MLDSQLVAKAAVFAAKAHAKQVRKYSGDPYIVHPLHVASIVATVPHSAEMVAAAMLHDTVEDCGVTYEELRQQFGHEVEDLVFWLTDPPKGTSGLNRAQRKAACRERMEIAPAEAQTIKYADLLSNGPSIIANDPDFAKVYIAEMTALLNVMVRGDIALRTQCWDMINDYHNGYRWEEEKHV